MQLTDEPDKRCYPLNGRLMCRSCHIQHLNVDHSAGNHQIQVSELCKSPKHNFVQHKYPFVLFSECCCMLSIYRVNHDPPEILMSYRTILMNNFIDTVVFFCNCLVLKLCLRCRFYCYQR